MAKTKAEAGAKTAAAPEGRAKPVPATKPEDRRSGRADRRTIIVLKGTAAYQDWLDGAAEKTRMPASVIFDVAVAKWAADNGLPEPPSRLGGRS